MAKAKQLPSGNWHIKVYDYTDASGKRHYEPFTDPDKKMVEYMAAEFKLNKKRKSQTRNWTVGEAIDGYIASKDGILSPATIQGYKKDRKNHLEGLMPVVLKDLTKDKVQSEINKECKKISPRTHKPLTPKSIENIYGLFSAAINMYYPDFKVKITLPEDPKKFIDLPPVEDVVGAILGTEIELPCLLAMWLSYTMSEVRGIKISVISDDGTVTIKEVIIDVDNKPLIKEKTKEYERTRRAALPPYIFNLVKKQETYKRAKKTGIDEYLITMDGKAIYRKLKKLLKENGIPHISFHKLRHYNASIMLLLNIPEKYAMERGGWATGRIYKNTYGHTFSDERKKADRKVNSYFGKIVKMKKV